jgi:N-carbamoyl-L-amino-acid hydrolase
MRLFCGSAKVQKMKTALTELRVDTSRFHADFDALAEIGATGDGGVHRPALSETHLSARDWFRRTVLAAGLEFRVDSAGNHSAFLACGPSDAPKLLLGSHSDSVPYGGRFDGALGLVAALETLRVVKDVGVALPVHLEAIDFTDEEGTLVGLMGSAAVAGVLQESTLVDPRGGTEALEKGLARAGLTRTGVLNARRDPATLAGYLELHIEQGTRLLDAGARIGIVTSIAGINSYRLAFVGRADHAGTTSIEERRDASLGASAFTLAVRDVVLERFPGCVATVGDARYVPGAFNIVPERVVLSLEFRAPESATFEQMEDGLVRRAREEAGRFGLGLDIEPLGKSDPTPMSQSAQQAFADAAQSMGLEYLHLTSGAGHDAQSLTHLCPAGMVFVPSVGGASHSPREFTEWEDCVNGANVLLQGALRLARALNEV